MSASVSMTMAGDIELGATLGALADAVQNTLTRKAVAKGAEVVRTYVAARAPAKAGWLKSAVAVKTKVYKNHNTAVAVVGIDMDVQRPHRGHGKDTFGEWPFLYTASVEQGFNRAPRKLRPGDKKRKHRANATPVFGYCFIPGKPFIRPAFDESQSEAMSAIADELETGLAKEAKKAARKKP